MSNFIETIKKAAIEAIENSKPCAIMFGNLTNLNPIKVNVEQKMILTKAQLIITKTVQEMNLTVNDKVVLLRMQGGQKYLILDKVIE